MTALPYFLLALPLIDLAMSNPDAGDLMLFVWMRWRIAPLVTGLDLRGTLVRVGIPAALMAVGMVLLPPVHVLVAIALGIVVYGLFGRLTGAWHPRDLHGLGRV